MSEQKLRKEILPSLEAAGLIVEEPDPLDKRQNLVMRPITENHRHPPDLTTISPTQTI